MYLCVFFVYMCVPFFTHKIMKRKSQVIDLTTAYARTPPLSLSLTHTHTDTIKKFDICVLTGWSSTLFILLVNIFDHTFNLFINNIC